MTFPKFLRIALRNEVYVRSLKVALVVGSVLNVINQYDAIFGDEAFSILKAGLTFCVPYCVATYGAVTALMALESG